jgi:small nuclear ribonucleoprotein (snRNP)-like protein
MNRVAMITLFVLSIAVSATAQSQTTGAQTQAPTSLLSTGSFQRMVQGTTVRVTMDNGYRFNGRVTSFDGNAMLVDGTRMQFDKIARIEKVSYSRLRNSTLVGLGVGVGIGFLGFALCGTEENYSDCTINLYLTPAIGTGIGLAIGALRHHGDIALLYDAGKRKTTVAFAPILSPARKGVAFSMTWR